MYLEKYLCPNIKCGLCSFQASKFVFSRVNRETRERQRIYNYQISSQFYC